MSVIFVISSLLLTFPTSLEWFTLDDISFLSNLNPTSLPYLRSKTSSLSFANNNNNNINNNHNNHNNNNNNHNHNYNHDHNHSKANSNNDNDSNGQTSKSSQVTNYIHSLANSSITGSDYPIPSLSFHPTYPSFPRAVIPTPPSESSSILQLDIASNSNDLLGINSMKSCIVLIAGKPVSCFEKTKFYIIQLAKLMKLSPLRSQLIEEYNSCVDVKRKKRKKRSLYFPLNKAHINGTRMNSKLIDMDFTSETRWDLSGSYNGLLDGKMDCIPSSFTLYKPYYMYNRNGQLRFILQFPQREMSQCTPKAVCNLTPESQNSIESCDGRDGSRFNCERKSCYHQLLSWDPEDPLRGPFPDNFEYECCCKCNVLFSRSSHSPCNRRDKRVNPKI